MRRTSTSHHRSLLGRVLDYVHEACCFVIILLCRYLYDRCHMLHGSSSIRTWLARFFLNFTYKILILNCIIILMCILICSKWGIFAWTLVSSLFFAEREKKLYKVRIGSGRIWWLTLMRVSTSLHIAPDTLQATIRYIKQYITLHNNYLIQHHLSNYAHKMLFMQSASCEDKVLAHGLKFVIVSRWCTSDRATLVHFCWCTSAGAPLLVHLC